MNARATLTAAHIGATIRLHQPTLTITGVLIGFHAHGATSLTLAGAVTVEYVAVTAVLHTDGEVVQVPITRDTTVQILQEEA